MTQGMDGKLRSELEALHAKWFKAFDSGDGATMDQMEMDNLTLVMPARFIWPKTTARAGSQPKRDPQTERTLSDVSARRFGDTAVLTGIRGTRRRWCSYRAQVNGRLRRPSGPRWRAPIRPHRSLPAEPTLCRNAECL